MKGKAWHSIPMTADLVIYYFLKSQSRKRSLPFLSGTLSHLSRPMRKDTREKRGRRDWKPYPNRAPLHSRKRFRVTGHYKAERVTGQSHGPSQTGAALRTLGDGGDAITGTQ